MNTLWNWGLNVVWLIFLLVLLSHFWRARQALVHARQWLKAKARITRCEWVDEGGTLWPRVEYVFVVNEKEVSGDHLLLDTAHSTPTSGYSRKVVYRAALVFKEQQEIDIYYNPNDPTESAVDISIPWKLNFIIGMIVLVLIGHILMMTKPYWY